MNAVEIEEAVSDLVIQPFDRKAFPFLFLEAFGNKETTITRLRKGGTNRTDVPGAVLQQKNIHVYVTEQGGVEEGLKALRESPKTVQQKAKFILATDGEHLQAEDLISGEAIVCRFQDLPKHFGFLLPLAGISTVAEIKNNPVDIKATGRLNKLYVELLKTNPEWGTAERSHEMNHFMARLIFCFFAEDTGIFNDEELFTGAVRQMSESDGSNTQEVIAAIFEAMNLDPREDERNGVRPYADQFPYVNGGLFDGEATVPKFSRIARTYLLRAGDLDWKAINPDIFGSMIQAVADDDERGRLGMHYTSVPNILKVLNPLFLESLREDLEKTEGGGGGGLPNKQQLGKLKKRLSHIRVFDPACGSGNFLVVAYKKMREIEHAANRAAGWGAKKSVIPLTNFRGIEIKSFAAEIARLALIIAEYQCDELYIGQREALALFLPLEKQNWITQGNALRLDWLSICPPVGEQSVRIQGDDFFETPQDQAQIGFDNEGGETYICGNPPYKGSQTQTKEQKSDLAHVFRSYSISSKQIDYVGAWFMKAAAYAQHTVADSAFVSTNSICQGRIVPILWPKIFETGAIIHFARKSFKWTNLARHNAGVTVAIIGLSRVKDHTCHLFDMASDCRTSVREAANITPYLTIGENVAVTSKRDSISALSEMSFGNMPMDGGHLLLSRDEMQALDLTPDQRERFIRRIYGSNEFIKGLQRYCVWIEDQYLEEALAIGSIQKRIEAVRAMRLASSDGGTRKKAKRPHQMREMNIGDERTIVVPCHQSENRPYLPVGLLPAGSIVSNAAFALYDVPLWNMALIASRLHLVWIATVCGKLETRTRYSNTLGWNTFPVLRLTEKNRTDLTECAENILLAREMHFPKTIADLYKPGKMPGNLRTAHDGNDETLERIYIGRRFKNDTERLEKLFEMYTEMTTNGKNH